MKRESHVSLMFKNYVNGHWETGATTGVAANPSDLDESIGEYARADARQTDAAVGAAHAAWREWSHSPVPRRAELLDAIGAEILARKVELGRLLAREVGKPLAEAIAETGRAAAWFKYFAAALQRRDGDRYAVVYPGVDRDAQLEPVGVVGIITPWSFPYELPALKIAAALAYGNCVVFKPAESASACAWQLTEIIGRSGLPAGVFNLVLGSGRQVGARIVTHPDVAALSFSGSPAVAEQVAQAGAARMRRVQLECGGKNTLVVLADADFDAAVNAAVDSAFLTAGQRSDAASRLIVERSLQARFVEALHSKLSRLKLDHALKRGIYLGPIANAHQLERDLDYVGIGQAEGAELICGGTRVERATRGHFVEPALFVGRPEHRIAREEIFGPVAVVLAADDYEHALALSNQVPACAPTQQTAAIFTQALKSAVHFRRHSRAATVTVNLPTTGVGGGAGSLRGIQAGEFYSQMKTAYWAA